MTCPVCGTLAVPGAKFCHNCGAALPAAATLPTAERRVVTVLFGDLSDFTSWSEDLDPERVGAVTDRVLAALAGAVKTFGGHVDKLTGDGIMAVFGAPVAHEDDAERAVRAALSMQRAVRRVLDDERGGGAPLGLRVGLNTGDVIAGIQAAIEYTVIGDTVNTAARLADAAAVGAVYAGARTSAATRHVASWRALRPLRLKGKREPVEAYELLGLLDAPGTRSGLGDEAPFVGRETEIGRVAGRLAEVIDRGEPRVLLMTAEAGIGKSRFAAEVERLAAGYDVGAGRYAAHTGARVLSVRCAAFGERRRLAPLADLVRAAVGLPNDPATALTRPAVEERLRRLGQRLGRLSADLPPIAVDQLLALLGYAELPAAAENGEWNAASPPPDAEAVPNAVADLLSALAVEAPLVMVVDDLHDATTETINALGLTLNRLSGPVLVLLLGRPELVRTAGALTRVADAEVHALPPLRGADASRLLTSYLGGGKLPQADADRLLATAQGNPFYLAELVTLLMERGALTAGPGRGANVGWRLTPGSLGSRLLSRDLAAVLAARIDALPPDARSVLRDAAVVGDTVPEGALEALREQRVGLAGRPSAVAAVEADRAVEELLQRRMLHRSRTGFAFATPLMREAAYAGVSKAELAERHATLARWAAPESVEGGAAPSGGFTEAARDDFVAEHVERATALADAVKLRPDAPARAVAPLGVAALGRAARRALRSGEPALAVEYAERAGELARDGLPLADRVVHARALLQIGRPADALAFAEKIAANAGDAAAIRVSALLLAGQAHQTLGDADRAERAWQEALQVATAAELPTMRASAMRRLGMADFIAGRLGQASSRLAASYQVSLSAKDPRGQAWSLQNLAWVTTTRGDFAGTDAVLGRAARLFAELKDPYGRAWLRGTTAFARLLAGRLREACRLAQVFLPFGERVGEAWAVGTLRAVEAYATAELGELAEADRGARRAYREFAEVGDDWGQGFALVVRGVVARGLGEPEHAADLLTDALGYADQTTHPLLTGMAGTLRGFVALDMGDHESAERDARAVLTTVEPHNPQAPAQVAPRVLLAMARLAAGDSATAVGLLAPVATAAANTPSLLFSRRQTMARYASALLAHGQREQALDWAQRAMRAPAEDVRSKVIAAMVLAETLDACGRRAEALTSAEEAVRLAYGTEQRSERAVAEALRVRLTTA
ncbi:MULTISPECIES: adenylate/guanylate cyclase domain-containing protein [Micromonospora]|uniref:Adenylate/guanylate cyclase domain-containing protein n=1 Tax=Micromonospora solifontis TaxID=2487138 RepID=A0ABX9WIZ7_9ACTN|nr:MULTISPECIES: adenylate/guanylate cyclase domain-containing protein [Micromonospora]NES17111.1 AAA family ATPase [Micromonospora sp. PPF5-17B]NES36732.1 AAA family ATPase [Micromonospora solifontis]NES55760.1 AAA family ATPase [Micromonospora sp. PPF5-6]RNL99193.1 adenylate/guanylate cyclase domain-containing protein [Micromonospora solifontis]